MSTSSVRVVRVTRFHSFSWLNKIPFKSQLIEKDPDAEKIEGKGAGAVEDEMVR